VLRDLLIAAAAFGTLGALWAGVLLVTRRGAKPGEDTLACRSCLGGMCTGAGGCARPDSIREEKFGTPSPRR